MARHPHVKHIDEVDWISQSHGERIVMNRKPLAWAAGGQKLGCSYYRVPPGKTAFPFHLHHSNEEAIYVLEGEGTLRIGSERVPVRAGDYIAFPADGVAHQLLNTSGAELVYLAMSTMQYPEVGEFPDSNKVAMFTDLGKDPNSPARKRTVFRKGETVDYYEGE